MPPHVLRCIHSKNRNCFLGVNPSTFTKNIRNASDFQVSIVRLHLNEQKFLHFSTFPDYTLKDGQFSLNGFFALKLSIEQDRFYEISEENESIECRSVTLTPVSVDDWELLQNNTEVTEDVFLHQIRILSLNMIFPIWLSGLCVLLRVVEMEPSDRVPFTIINSSTHVTVIPEYRETLTTPSQLTSETVENQQTLTLIIRSLGNWISSSLPSSPLSVFYESPSKTKPSLKTCKLVLIPGRQRRLLRVDIDENARNPTIARINRSDWLTNDQDSTDWPSQFVGKLTIYRSSKEIKLNSTVETNNSTVIPDRLPKTIYMIVQLTNDDVGRKKHIRFHPSFASINGIRPTDRCIASNSSRRPQNQCQIELISNQWHGPIQLLQHYFYIWVRENSTIEQPILLSDNCSIQLDPGRFFVHLMTAEEVNQDETMTYVALNEEIYSQYPLLFTEKTDLNFNEIDTFSKTALVDEFFLRKNASLSSTDDVERLLTIIELQLDLNEKNSLLTDFFLKNVIISGRNGSGKKTLVRECCQRLWKNHLVYLKFVDCLSFKGRKLENILSSISQIIDDVIFRTPSVLVLDHFDDLFPNEGNLTDANLIFANLKLSLSVRQLFDRVQKHHRQFIIIPIVRQLSSVHRIFTEETPLFCSQIINIEALNSSQRTNIIQQLIAEKQITVPGSLLHSIVHRTESFVINDLRTLIENAVLHLWMSLEDRPLCSADFDYAFDEFQPISVKLLRDDPKKGMKVNLHWSDIGGLEEIKRELVETVQWRFQHSNYFSNAPIRLISGVLLYGPSGCGKTLIAQVLANECQVNFLQVKGPELLNKYVGSSEQNVRDLFTRARSVTPCIILFDEFEALVPRRGRDSAGVTDRVVNQLLTELDGVESLGDIVVIASTSRPDLIDPALLRPGRLDKHFYVGFPYDSDLLSILRIWTKQQRLSADVRFEDEEFLSMCRSYTGADIKALVYNAQLAAFDEHQSKESLVLSQRHFVIAAQQTPKSIPEQMRKAQEHFYQNWRKPIVIDQQTVSLA